MTKSRAEMTPAEVLIDRLKTVAAVMILLVTGTLMIFGWREKREEKADIAAHLRYTIATVTGSDYVISPSSHTVTFFSYQANDSTYTSDITGSVADEQTRYLLKYSAAHPEYHVFYERVPIPDSIAYAPADGWRALPFPVAAENLD